MLYQYFNLEHAIQVQDYIIKESGGRPGLLNKGLLESILEHIQNDFYYENLEDKLCHLFFSINKNHAFNDGNKRSSIVLSAYFLEINGADFLVDKFIKQMENIAVSVADNKIDKCLLHEIICELIYKVEFSESLRLKIAIALMK
ncbi:type II toxin-antitoxin system death-on-curing family toxin [Chishuiella sp.]|uniref:type II toxin-antitoxin system death-on-curing family toxin n=1 Tax=Chishuiella sp. TaxID=1969467 RepID=UPI0028AF7BE3|nr:type II toxin-antitoxin system death-on-curing family toxin [Chishuiella sp.]